MEPEMPLRPSTVAALALSVPPKATSAQMIKHDNELYAIAFAHGVATGISECADKLRVAIPPRAQRA